MFRGRIENVYWVLKETHQQTRSINSHRLSRPHHYMSPKTLRNRYGLNAEETSAMKNENIYFFLVTRANSEQTPELRTYSNLHISPIRQTEACVESSRKTSSVLIIDYRRLIFVNCFFSNLFPILFKHLFHYAKYVRVIY